MHGDGVADVEGRVTNKLGAVAVDHLRVAGLRGVGIVLGEAHVQHVGPLQERLCQILVVESGVYGAVPAMKKVSMLIFRKRCYVEKGGLRT